MTLGDTVIFVVYPYISAIQYFNFFVIKLAFILLIILNDS